MKSRHVRELEEMVEALHRSNDLLHRVVAEQGNRIKLLEIGMRNLQEAVDNRTQLIMALISALGCKAEYADSTPARWIVKKSRK